MGGRPPGCGKAIGDIPHGIEVLVKKAAVDPVFRVLLLTHRAAAADQIGLKLEPTEVLMLDHVPAAHLEAIINRTKVDPSRHSAFLGKVAGVMLAALGASGIVSKAAPTFGSVTTKSTTQPATQPAPPPVRPDELRPRRGVRVERPAVKVGGVTVQRPPRPATQPTSRPTTQPATRPTLSAEQIRVLIQKLDDDKFTVRDAAHKKLQGQGVGILPALREALKDKKLTVEVRTRLDSIVKALAATTQPAPTKPRPVMSTVAGIMIVDD